MKSRLPSPTAAQASVSCTSRPRRFTTNGRSPAREIHAISRLASRGGDRSGDQLWLLECVGALCLAAWCGARTLLVVTPMQAVSVGPRRAPRSVLPLTPSSCLNSRNNVKAAWENRGCGGPVASTPDEETKVGTQTKCTLGVPFTSGREQRRKSNDARRGVLH